MEDFKVGSRNFLEISSANQLTMRDFCHIFYEQDYIY